MLVLEEWMWSEGRRVEGRGRHSRIVGHSRIVDHVDHVGHPFVVSRLSSCRGRLSYISICQHRQMLTYDYRPRRRHTKSESESGGEGIEECLTIMRMLLSTHTPGPQAASPPKTRRRPDVPLSRPETPLQTIRQSAYPAHCWMHPL